MDWKNAFPSVRLADSPTIEPPIRIILHIQSSTATVQDVNLHENRARIANAFINHKALESTKIYVHLPSGQDGWESQVILDYCTGDMPEGSVADQVPLCVYLVSQYEEHLTFEKAKTTQLTYLNAQIATETFPWKSETFLEHPTDTENPEQNDPQKNEQTGNEDRRKTRSEYLQIFQTGFSELEAKLRRNIEGRDLEPSTQHNTSSTLHPARNTISISNTTSFLRDQAIRVLLEISTENLPGNLRERCTIASKTFAQLMLRNEYPTTRVYRLIRGMEPSAGELWMVVDYWIGRSKGKGNPPLLIMSYRGNMTDGTM